MLKSTKTNYSVVFFSFLVMILAELKNAINGLNVKLDKVDKTLDHQKQYFRRNCLLKHGIDEENQDSADEVVDSILKEEMDEE